jgi:hypothetical protein
MGREKEAARKIQPGHAAQQQVHVVAAKDASIAVLDAALEAAPQAAVEPTWGCCPCLDHTQAAVEMLLKLPCTVPRKHHGAGRIAGATYGTRGSYCVSTGEPGAAAGKRR